MALSAQQIKGRLRNVAKQNNADARILMRTGRSLKTGLIEIIDNSKKKERVKRKNARLALFLSSFKQGGNCIEQMDSNSLSGRQTSCNKRVTTTEPKSLHILSERDWRLQSFQMTVNRRLCVDTLFFLHSMLQRVAVVDAYTNGIVLSLERN